MENSIKYLEIHDHQLNQLGQRVLRERGKRLNESVDDEERGITWEAWSW